MRLDVSAFVDSAPQYASGDTWLACLALVQSKPEWLTPAADYPRRVGEMLHATGAWDSQELGLLRFSRSDRHEIENLARLVWLVANEIVEHPLLTSFALTSLTRARIARWQQSLAGRHYSGRLQIFAHPEGARVWFVLDD